MEISKKLFLAFGATAMLLLPTIAASVFAQSQTGNVNITQPPTCGLSLPTSVNYGTVQAGATSSEVVFGITNTGNTAGAVSITGTNWTQGSNTVMLGNRTHFGPIGSTYAFKTPIQTTPTSVGSFPPGTSGRALQLQAVLLIPSFSGTSQQTLTFSSSC